MNENIVKILIVLFGIVFYLVVVMPIRQLNCERFGMDADLLTHGCVVRVEK